MSQTNKSVPQRLNTLFVLIHGTWAPRSAWTQDGSQLIERLRNTFGEAADLRAKIISPEWGGANREAARLQGGETVARAVREVLDGPDCDDHTKVFFITHSHGTDVALKALQLMNEEERILGIAMFNSPNILTLKRDFGSAFKNLMGFLKISLLLLLVTNLCFLMFWMLSDEGPDLVGGFTEIAVIAFLIAVWFVLREFARPIADFIDRHAKTALKKDYRRSVATKNDVPIISINSSSDEAWNALNFLTAITQLPFYLTHKLVGFTYTLIIFFLLSMQIGTLPDPAPDDREFPFTFSSVTGYHKLIDHRNESQKSAAENAMISASQMSPFVEEGWLDRVGKTLMSSLAAIVASTEAVLHHPLWWIAIFTSVSSAALLNTAALIAIALFSGYAIAWLVEALALGDPRRPNLDFLTTRKIIGLVPIDFQRITFFDAASGGSILDHSVPYSDPRTLDRIMIWIREHSK